MTTRILLSYWYHKNTDIEKLIKDNFAGVKPDIFADSGGFSAMTQGAQIDVNEYAAWIKRYKHLFNTYANLDVIGNAGATLDNQHRLEDLGVEPIPVFHVNEDWTQLESYIEQYPYIALGGMVPYMRYTKKIMPWIIKAFKLAGDKSVFHGFGATSWEVIKDLPWYSVDSTTWMAGHRYGAQFVFAKGRLFQARANVLRKYVTDLNLLGFTLKEAISATQGNMELSKQIACASVAKAEEYLQIKNPDFRIYMAGLES